MLLLLLLLKCSEILHQCGALMVAKTAVQGEQYSKGDLPQKEIESKPVKTKIM